MISLISFLSIFLTPGFTQNQEDIQTLSIFSEYVKSKNYDASLIINKISKGLKYILDMTLIGVIDDISGAFFGLITTSLIISFMINIFQYFDVTIFEEEIKKSVISFYLLDFAPNTFAYFIDFFPSLEFIVEQKTEKTIV